ncbi:MAG: excinuclease ABC subunit UvrA, partial [Bdellovibrionales bacterium]|nr:excinuclease ABC subunit UvrA [Bdellovibrionales bacterium]
MKSIRLWGAKQNNLKNVEVSIPLGSFTVVCGPSGSGKSSLAFDTLYAEGQRRYVESLSHYSRQFLNKAPKPDLEGIENIPPALAIEQKNSVRTSRSTVGTSTEIVDYLRLLFAKAGVAYCPEHHIPLEADSPSLAADKLLQTFPKEKGYILVPVPKEGRLFVGKKLHSILIQDGNVRVYFPSTKKKKGIKKSVAQATYVTEPFGEIVELSDSPLLVKKLQNNDFYLVVDRLLLQEEERSRMTDSLAQAFRVSLKYSSTLLSGQAVFLTVEGKKILLSEDLSCSLCGFKFPQLSPAFFSFNSPVGACSDCKGFGNTLELDEKKIVPNPALNLIQGAVAPFAMPSAAADRRQLRNFAKKHQIDLLTPWEDLPLPKRQLIWNGTEDFYGVKGLFEYLETKKYKMHIRVFLSRFKSPFPCSTCHGTRLKSQTQQVLVGGKNLTTLCQMTLQRLLQEMIELKLSAMAEKICREVLHQIRERLRFLVSVGVGYLTVDRPTKTLSGGEYQRLNLAHQLGMGLSQTLYVLDEPTVGLHPRDNERLIQVLHELRNQDNTLVVVEHDHDVILNASHVIEMGPGSGHLGGEVLISAPVEDFLNHPQSLTARYLQSHGSHWLPPRTPRPTVLADYKYILELSNCRGNNLKNVTLRIPLNRLITVTGVSGSGKSTLITQTLYPALARALGSEFVPELEYERLQGADFIHSTVLIDQSPIGKTARSNPVTYLKIYDAIRAVMAATPEAKAQGYTASTFSLNVEGGRCPLCKGLGYELVDMLFMDDIEVKCEACDGKRFTHEILSVTYQGKNIGEILDLTVAEAMNFFVSQPQIRKSLGLLGKVGLEYIRLGQSANSLSGGESQRLKIARELLKAGKRTTLYILDEPTTGLHFREVHLLLTLLHQLVDAGNCVVLVEHNLEVILHSDYIIDIGPEAG